MPAETNPVGILFWRRPTLARPFVALPSGLQRFTAVFGMGTGGATALLSPESDAGLAVRRFGAGEGDAELWWRGSCLEGGVNLSNRSRPSKKHRSLVFTD